MSRLWPLLSAVLLTSAAARAKPTTATALNWDDVNRTCLAHICHDTVNAAQLRTIQRNMDSEAQPCDDFHAYACGNWPREHRNGTTIMRYAEDRLSDKYVALFEGDERWRLPPPTDNDAVVAKMLAYYGACRGSETLSLRGYVEEMRRDDDAALWQARNFSWVESAAQLGRYGYTGHFLQLHVKQVNASCHRIAVLPHDKDERVVLTPAHFSLLREYMSVPRTLEQLAEEFGALEASLEAIVTAGIQRTADGDECDQIQTYSYDELRRKLPEIDWARFLGAQLRRAVRPDELIEVDSVATVRGLARHLNQPQIGGGELYFLYTLARFMRHLERQPHGPLQRGRGTRACVRHMRKILYLPMTYVYERAYYGRVRAESDRIIRAVFAQLKAEFARTLNQNRMQFEPRDVAFLQRKLLAIRLNIGNLPTNVTPRFFAEHVRGLDFTDSFYANHLAALRHTYAHQRRLADLHAVPESIAEADPSDATSESARVWLSFNSHMPDMPDGLEATPYYYALSNMIVVPHAYLRAPFYDRRFWPALLYGDLANTLGHELMHAFDPYFLEYDARGNLFEAPAARIAANERYAENVECLERGTRFLTERVADVSGTRLALNAFLGDTAFRRRNGRLYFMQFAQFFCSALSDPAAFEAQDPYHDVDSLRLNYAMAQTPAFAEVFECAPGTPMNPTHRCQMW